MRFKIKEIKEGVKAFFESTYHNNIKNKKVIIHSKFKEKVQDYFENEENDDFKGFQFFYIDHSSLNNKISFYSDNNLEIGCLYLSKFELRDK